jgi:ABC-type multidrug transport system ATPase subunit
VESAAIEITGLTVRYGGHRVLDGLSMRVGTGSAVCVTGANGAGKSTLLRCICGIQRYDSGTVSVFGRTDRPVEFWRTAATTVEAPSWYPGLTVREHVELVRRANGADQTDDHAERLLTTFGLEQQLDCVPMVLSSGQRQRLILSMVLARPSRLLLLDEPEQRLDTGIRAVLAGLLVEYLAAGGTVLMTSHDERFAEQAGFRLVPLTSIEQGTGGPGVVH